MPTLQNFVDQVGPPISAAWLNRTDLVQSQIALGTSSNYPLGVAISKSVTTAETKNNNATLANSIYLSGNITPGTYRIEVGFLYTTPANAGFQANINYSGTVVNSGLVGYGAFSQNTPQVGLVVASVGVVQSLVTTPSITVAGGTNTGPSFLIVTGIVVVSTPGTLGFAWAQATATVGNTTLALGSYATIIPVA